MHTHEGEDALDDEAAESWHLYQHQQPDVCVTVHARDGDAGSALNAVLALNAMAMALMDAVLSDDQTEH